jgi:hypothetical protein
LHATLNLFIEDTGISDPLLNTLSP